MKYHLCYTISQILRKREESEAPRKNSNREELIKERANGLDNIYGCLHRWGTPI